jgi:FMN phosphatase YigB (HAD superfamily)
MRTKLYNLLVNRVPGIAYRYHRMHDGATGVRRPLSWLYLLWLNFCYYGLFCRILGRRPDMPYYEARRLPLACSESELHGHKHPELSVEAFVGRLKGFDVISFDVFDTLILRPLALPTDVFYLIGERLGILDFRNLRIRAEWDARMACRRQQGHTEVTLSDIWQTLAGEVGCDPEEGMRLELETEEALCCANPFLLEVWNRLRAMGKRIVIISDMYLPQSAIVRLLERAGYTGAEKVYVSCEYRRNKASGTLFRLVREELGNASVIHVGDNPTSDGTMAAKYGFATCPYPNVNGDAMLYRPFDMSFLVGSAYRGLVSNHLYNGLHRFSMAYEYGYVYGGLFVLGYCHFIHDYCEKNRVDRVLFLSRDGDILKQVYDRLFPGSPTVYAYWSRKAAAKLMADEDRHDYFRRFVDHKVNQGYLIREILRAMELDFLAEELDAGAAGGRAAVPLRPEEQLTDRNSRALRRFIEARWDRVLAAYQGQQAAARKYYDGVLRGARRALAVDIGWAGSGALALSHLAEKVWGIPCEITGMVAGTNTIHNAEPDASEPFLQSGKLVAYLFSQSHNRDVMKKHDLNRDYNVFWELLLSSPTPQFQGFTLDGNGEVRLNFGRYDENQEGIREIQRGILDFAAQYQSRFSAFPYLLRISGRDAYAPMLVAASYGERYLKRIEQLFRLRVNVE